MHELQQVSKYGYIPFAVAEKRYQTFFSVELKLDFSIFLNFTHSDLPKYFTYFGSDSRLDANVSVRVLS